MANTDFVVKNGISATTGSFTGVVTAGSYIGITSANVTSALGFTPASGTSNPVVTSSQTLSPGTYFVNTTSAAITVTLSATLLGAYTFIDAAATWATHNLTINGGSFTIGSATGQAATFIANVSDYQFSLSANSTYWGLC